MSSCNRVFILVLVSCFIFFASPIKPVKADSLTIIMAGDVMLGSWGIEEIQKNGLEYPIQNLRSAFSDSDVNMCNIEAPFTSSSDKFPDKTYTFKVPVEYIEVLSKLNIHYVTLANNHIMDYGKSGLEETIKTLNEAGINFSGSGLTESEALEPAVFAIKNKKIAVIAAGAIFPKEFWATDTTAGVFFPWEEKLIAALNNARPTVDYLFVTFHWGAEKRETPKKYQNGLASLCINHGADLVWGHHPHVVQGIELYKGKPVIYSLGNFIFASFSQSANGMVVKAIFNDTEMVSLQILPLNVDNFANPLQPSFFNGQKKIDFINKVTALSDSITVGKVKFNEDGFLVTLNKID